MVAGESFERDAPPKPVVREVPKDVEDRDGVADWECNTEKLWDALNQLPAILSRKEERTVNPAETEKLQTSAIQPF